MDHGPKCKIKAIIFLKEKRKNLGELRVSNEFFDKTPKARLVKEIRWALLT